MIEVNLTWPEIRFGAMVGITREAQDREEKKINSAQAKAEGGWDRHVMGALGEMAFAKWANIFWSGSLGDYHADDVGPYQVRAIYGERHRLIIRPGDKDNKKFILVWDQTPKYFLMGWQWAGNIKRKVFWENPNGRDPAFFVPQTALFSMEDWQ